MKKQCKGFFSGILVTLLLVAFVGSAMAASYQKQATLNYSGIKITLNGQTITPADANGNAVEPFSIDGTTYLPIRGIANALGLGVEWDAATQTVKLTGENASNGTQSPAASAGTVLVDRDGIKVTYTGINTKGTFGTDIKVLIENNSQKTYTVQARELSINGFMCSPIFSSEIAPGKKINDEITIMKTELEKNGITTIETIECYFTIFNSSDWSDEFESDVVTINCK